jgi:hypothetical protein
LWYRRYTSGGGVSPPTGHSCHFLKVFPHLSFLWGPAQITARHSLVVSCRALAYLCLMQALLEGLTLFLSLLFDSEHRDIRFYRNAGEYGPYLTASRPRRRNSIGIVCLLVNLLEPVSLFFNQKIKRWPNCKC